jgi:hypothetical protein
MDSTAVALSALLLAFLTVRLESRKTIDLAIREERAEGYRELWSLTGQLPRWPPGTKLTRGDIVKLSIDFRDWYFKGHGMYLSRQSRQFYDAVQELLTKHSHRRPAYEELPDPDYREIRKQLSALRGSMTNDLLSRSQALTFRTHKNA